MRSTLVYVILALLFLSQNSSINAQEAKSLPPLDAKLRVKVGEKLEPSCQFLLPAKADQSFENNEYQYAVLDKDGNQVDDAFIVRAVQRTISLPKTQRSVTDATDVVFQPDKLTSGEEYYFVVSVRNLTGLAKFKAP